jgi:antitoxin (DNA-binding transcriptional repressor) of toxin-antitoxin stability system
MKTVTVREFYHNTHLVDRLAEGKKLLVTANGKPKFVVSKCSRPKMSRELAEKRAVGASKDPRFNGTAFLASLKK